MTSVEPLDITQLLAQAAPSLEDLQKVITNLVTLTDSLAEPGSDIKTDPHPMSGTSSPRSTPARAAWESW